MYNKEIIEKTLNLLKINSNTFFKVLEEEKEKTKEKKFEEEQELFQSVYIENVFKSIPEEYDNVESFFENFINKKNFCDYFYLGEEGIDDNGEDEIVYFKIGDNIYEVEIHCDPQLVGDFSVRKNLHGNIYMTSFKEVKYEILQESERYIDFKIKK